MLRFLWDYVWCRVNAPNLPIWLISDTASAEWWLKRKTNEQNKCHSVICEVSWSRRYMATYGDIWRHRVLPICSGISSQKKGRCEEAEHGGHARHPEYLLAVTFREVPETPVEHPEWEEVAEGHGFVMFHVSNSNIGGSWWILLAVSCCHG